MRVDPEPLVDHHALREHLQNFFQIFLQHLNLYHFQKLLFVLKLDIVTIHSARDNEKEQTRQEHDELILLLDTVEVNHKHAAYHEASTGLKPVGRHK